MNTTSKDCEGKEHYFYQKHVHSEPCYIWAQEQDQDNCSNKKKGGVQDNGDMKNYEQFSEANLEFSTESSEKNISPESRNLVNISKESARSDSFGENIERQSKGKFTSTTVSKSNNMFRGNFIHAVIMLVNCLITLYLF